MPTIHDLLAIYRAEATSTADQGHRFERLIRAFLRTDPYYQQLFAQVWLWQDWPGRQGRPDTGIDLVAQERDTETMWAIQCKFYQQTIEKADLDSFFTESGKTPFGQRLIVTTAPLSQHAEEAFEDQQIPVHTLTLTDLDQSRVDWGRFTWEAPEHLALRAVKTLRPHQIQAIQDVREGFEQADRGQLIMACGTGKTLTGLRLAEQLLPSTGGTVLVLTPSIALVSQTLREWTAEAERPLRAFAVCSDVKVGTFTEDEDLRPSDLAFPATTNAERLAEQWAQPGRPGTLTVIFSTYQSIAIVEQAQALAHRGPLDLIIADEAHRAAGHHSPTGDKMPSYFTRVHNDRYLPAKKRLYMTATPRIYSDKSKRKADEKDLVLFSMDDPAVFGPEFHRLNFSAAVEAEILADYKVLILTVDETEATAIFGDTEHLDARLDDEAKIVGCLNALAKRFPREEDDEIDPAPMHRVVAFTETIAASKRVTNLFTQANAGLSLDGPLRCYESEHIDGTMNVTNRNAALDRLRESFADTTCRIVTNVRCLTEGVDVPALDAVVFLQPRNSQVDVVQAVGRVMRKAEGKQFGYVILPVVIPAGMDPETALKDSNAYQVVWQVLNALRSHDDHFNDLINQLEFNRKSTKIHVIGRGRSHSPDAEQLGLFTAEQWQKVFYAKIVEMGGTREYWDEWARKVGNLADRYQQRITAIVEQRDETAHTIRTALATFLTGLQASVNDQLTQADAIEMLAQHLVTQPIFDALFEGYAFTASNPVSQVMAPVVDQLTALAAWKEAEGVETVEGRILTAIRKEVHHQAHGIDNALGKQQLIVRIYDKFFKVALKKTADRLGIVYTPTEIVDFILHSVDAVLQEQWGTRLSAPAVHVLDPFTGTGTFLVRLLQSGLIAPEDLDRKYREELHANELVLLAYYIAAINIEETFHRLTGQPYTPFPGIALTDTFEQGPGRAHEVVGVARAENNARVNRQNATEIRVIVGNPPYSVGQRSQNDNNQNLKYPALDARIRDTYVAASSAKNKNSLYDAYIRALRWASDRIGERGVVAFVTNGAFLERTTAEGVRRSLATEFSSIYCLNLRGFIRGKVREDARREGQGIFDIQTGVAITVLVKNPSREADSAIYYYDIGDYLTREEKLNRVQRAGHINRIVWTTIKPNVAGDWINPRNEDFATLSLMGTKERGEDSATIWSTYSNGIQTNRDAWVYNFSKVEVRDNVQRMITKFNQEVDRYNTLYANTDPDQRPLPYTVVDRDPKQISWSSSLLPHVAKNHHSIYSPTSVVQSTYRPFCKQWLYFDRIMNHRPYLLPKLFPDALALNHAIVVTGVAARRDFSVFITSNIPDLEVLEKAQCFPLYYYELAQSAAQPTFSHIIAPTTSQWTRRDAITNWALQECRQRYGLEVTKEDIFYYVYGLLHASDYRTRFANDLKKMLPRIPWVDHRDDFWAFSQAGRDLAHWHLDYETIDPWPVEEVWAPGLPNDPAVRYHVEKLRFGKLDTKTPDKTMIIVNSYLTLRGIPMEVDGYVVNGRSAIEWVMDRYQIKQDKASGIVNDPNQWSEDPRYIVELVKRVVRVSMETVKIVENLPDLHLSDIVLGKDTDP